jgi:hypothetical protein
MRNFISSLPWEGIVGFLLGLLATFLNPFIEDSSLKVVRRRNISRLNGRIRKLRLMRETMQQLQEVGDFEASALRFLFWIASISLLSLVTVMMIALSLITADSSSLGSWLSSKGWTASLALFVLILFILWVIFSLVRYSLRNWSLLAKYPVTDGEIEGISASIVELEGRLAGIEKQ